MNLVVINVEQLQALIQSAVTQALKEFQPESSPNVFTVEEAGEYLRVSESTMRRLIREKQIPTFNVRRQLFLRQMDIDAWVRKQLKTKDVS